jgi:hypothetical protein
MSFHNHDTEDYNKKYTPKERERATRLGENILKQGEAAQQSFNKEIAEDMLFLERMKEFDLTEKDIRSIKHFIGLPDGRGIQFLLNYIQARTGSAIAHYENKFINGMPLGKFNERQY